MYHGTKNQSSAQKNLRMNVAEFCFLKKIRFCVIECRENKPIYFFEAFNFITLRMLDMATIFLHHIKKHKGSKKLWSRIFIKKYLHNFSCLDIFFTFNSIHLTKIESYKKYDIMFSLIPLRNIYMQRVPAVYNYILGTKLNSQK